MLNSESFSKAKERARQDQPFRRIRRRIVELDRWLTENGHGCRAYDRHLKDGTTERAYWHYGYMAALQDVIATLKPQKKQ